MQFDGARLITEAALKSATMRVQEWKHLILIGAKCLNSFWGNTSNEDKCRHGVVMADKQVSEYPCTHKLQAN
jgi:hypothetical protein